VNSPDFGRFFNGVTGGHEPFDYQRRLAGGDSGTTCCSQLINILARHCKQNTIVLAKG
jgi:hypothetical protein